MCPDRHSCAKLFSYFENRHHPLSSHLRSLSTSLSYCLTLQSLSLSVKSTLFHLLSLSAAKYSAFLLPTLSLGHSVSLSLSLPRTQEDMRLVICQQVEEKEKLRKATLQRGSVTSRSLRLRGEEERPRKVGFFSTFFSKE